VLQRRVVGQTIDALQVLPPKGGPIAIRDLTQRGFAETLTGAASSSSFRSGLWLIQPCSSSSIPS
jgi:hypothetical protein